MAQGVSRLHGATIRFTRIVAFVGLLALLALAAVILANALLAWLFNAPIDGVRDWVRLIVAVAVGACIPAVLATRQNITIRFVGKLLGKRGEVVLELFGALITWLVLAVLAWQLQIYVIELFRDGETTENLGMPVGPWWQAVTVLFYLSVVVQTLIVASLCQLLIRGGRLPAFHEESNAAGADAPGKT